MRRRDLPKLTGFRDVAELGACCSARAVEHLRKGTPMKMLLTSGGVTNPTIRDRLVALLGQYAGTVLTYADLIRRMWGPNAKQDNQILRVNMANIRRKIEKDPAHPRYIFTETGIGYRMADK